jgi:hypothetical protein
MDARSLGEKYIELAELAESFKFTDHGLCGVANEKEE